MIELVLTAISLKATVYGVYDPAKGRAEMNCGDPGTPVACDTNAVTASGERFNPNALTAAVPAPFNRIMRPLFMCIRNPNTGKEVVVWINDKSNERWQGNRGLDLTPATFEALTGKPAKPWSSIPKLEKC